ncbi:MAG: hypothetical protein RIS86_945 [Planctomycetota bacterium]
MPSDEEQPAPDGTDAEGRPPSLVAAARRSIVEALGLFSSHPSFAIRRLRIVRTIALLPVTVLLGTIGYKAWGAVSSISSLAPEVVLPRLVPLLNAVLALPDTLMIALAAGAAVLLTASLTIRASAIRSLAAAPRSESFDRILGLLLVGSGLAVCLTVAWLVSSPLLSLDTRWWIVGAALLPLYLLMLILDWSEPVPDDASGTWRLLKALGWAIALPFITATTLLAVPAAAEWLSKGIFLALGGLTKFVGALPAATLIEQILEKKLAPTIARIAGMASAAVVVGLVTFRVAGLQRELERKVRALRGRFDASIAAEAAEIDEAEGAERGADRTGCVGRLLLGVARGLGLAADDPCASTPPPAPEPTTDAPRAEAFTARLRERAAAAGHDVSIEIIEERPIDGQDSDTSLPIEHDGLSWIFGGVRPSTDQRALLEAFQFRWTEHLRFVRDARYGADRESHADLLVECERGSGDASAVAACAIFAAVARGQRVLMLVATPDEAAARVESMRGSLARMGFETLYSIDRLDRETVASWCPAVGASAIPDGAPPDIAVAVFDDYERVFFAGAYESTVISHYQRSLEVVIVERIDRMVRSDAVRMHLPFILDKHRLMLRTVNRGMQLMLTAAPLAGGRAGSDTRGKPTTARRHLAMRFFGGDGGLHGTREPSTSDGPQVALDDREAPHLVYLRSRAARRPRTTVVETSRTAVEDVRSWVLGELCRSGTTAILSTGERREKTEARLGVHGGRAPRIVTIEELAASPELGLGIDRWLCDHVPQGDGAVDIDGAVAATGGTLVVVAPRGVRTAQERRGRSPTLPVFPTPDAPALFVAHLRSAASVLEADVPCRREEFARFGLDWDDRHGARVARAHKPKPLHERWWMEVDGTIDDLLAGSEDRWPAIFIRREGLESARPVDLDAPPRTGLCLLPSKGRLEIAESRHQDDPHRYATWITTRGLHLGQSDLAYFRPVTFDGARLEFRAVDIERRPGGVVVKAVPTSTDGGDFVVPVRRTRLAIGTGMEIEGPRMLRSFNAFLFRLHEVTAPCTCDESIEALATIGAEGVEAERRRIPSIKFSMQVGVTVLAIGGALPKQDAIPLLRARYEGTWDTGARVHEHARGRDPWHALTRAVGYAVHRVAPSLLRFAHFHGFRPPSEQAGATILVLEPSATQGTAIDALSTLLDDTGFRARFVEEFRRAAREGLRAPDAARVDGDESEDPEASVDELLALADLLESGPMPVVDPPLQADREDAAFITAPIEDDTLPPEVPEARSAIELPTAGHRWRDINAATRDDWLARAVAALDQSPEYAVEIGISADLARAETLAFGWHSELDRNDREALRAASIRIEECARTPNRFIYGPDYEAMIARNLETVRPVAQRLVELAERSGVRSNRAKAGLIASFVQSFEYELQREGDVDDGKVRCGVQVPVATLHARRGDCDSVAVLVACLVRASGIGRSGVVLVEESDGGHAMAAVDCPPVYGDSILRCRFGKLVMIEATHPWRLGQVSPEYHGRYARLVAFG